MGHCCQGDDYDAFFTGRRARKAARRYRRRGLTHTATLMVEYLCAHRIEGASVLEIGGGVGQLHLELLRRGASEVTNLEISTNYEAEAVQLLAQSGMTGRVTRRIVDIAQAPDEVAAADIVILHRVVCCYDDYVALLSAAGSHAERLLVFSHPPRNLPMRAQFWVKNLVRRARHRPFRTFVHPPAAMVSALEKTGLRTGYEHRGWSWHIVGLERSRAERAVR